MMIQLFAKDSQPPLPFRPLGEGLEWLGRKMVLLTSTELAAKKSFADYLRLALSAPGAFLRLLASLDKPYLQIERPEASARQEEPPKRELRVLTLNAACLPSWITTKFNNLRASEVRAKEIADTIMQHHAEYDVICLQEVFSDSACDIFLQTLKSRYGWSVHHAGEPYIGFNSGLCLFSKFPIEKADFQKYSGLVGEDAFTNKGFLSADIRAFGQTVRVYTTHTQAGGYPEFLKKSWLWGSAAERRKSHFAAFEKHMQTAQTDTVIVTGDFNLDLLSEDDKKKNADSFFTHFQPFRPETSIGTSLTDSYLKTHNVTKHVRQPNDPHLPTKERVIDGLLVTNGSKAKPLHVRVEEIFTNSSDHLAITSTFTLTPNS